MKQRPRVLCLAARAATLFRLAATFPFAALLTSELARPSRGGGGVLGILFAAIALSDFVDGRLARAAGASSRSWGRLDVLADVLFNATILAVAAAAGALRPWLPIAVVVLGARHLWRTREGVDAAPDPLGRIAGILFYVASGAVVADAVVGLPGRPALSALGDALALYAAFVLARALVRT